MSNVMLKFAFPTPTKGASARELTIIEQGKNQTTHAYSGDAIASEELGYDEEAELVLSLVDIGPGGNRTTPCDIFVYNVADDVVPPEDNCLGVLSRK